MTLPNAMVSQKRPNLDTTTPKVSPFRTQTSSMVANQRVTLALKQSKMPSTYSIQPRRERTRKDGTAKLSLSININKKRLRFPLDIWVPLNKWDKKKQIVTGRTAEAKDRNLEIENTKAKINEILVGMRLGQIPIDVDAFEQRFVSKTFGGCFIQYWEQELKKQKGLIKESTLRQQKSIKTKLSQFMSVIPFQNINVNFMNQWISWMRLEKGNAWTTVYVALKSFRKYVNRAKDDGYEIPLKSKQIKVKDTISMRTFLSRAELKRMHKFFFTDECYGVHKDCLRKFLFSCYTGLRMGDVNKIEAENIENDIIYIQNDKGDKIQRYAVSKKALLFINDTDQFGNILPGTRCPVTINKQLKVIATKLKIKKDISFHCARHTFATQFLELGGDVTVLQKLLNHSKIRETMVYVHITPRRKADGAKLFDKLNY